MAKQQQNNKNRGKKDSGAAFVGAGLAALAAAAAGAYFLYGSKKGEKRRKEIKGWMLRLKGDVIEKMEDMKDVSEETYHNVVDNVAGTYKGLKNVDKEELGALVTDLKKHWNNIQKHVRGSSKKASRSKEK